jgi:PAS domain S-box-containing protein
MSADATGPSLPPPEPHDAASPSERVRWQSFFQRSDDPLFLLNRRLRLLFVNRAWEALTGFSGSEALGLVCRRAEPAAPNQPLPLVLAHVLCPPSEVLNGVSSRTRRLLPGRGTGQRWWDVEFLPLRSAGRPLAILGRIVPLPAAQAAPLAPLPERLVNLRQRAVERHGLDLLPTALPAMRRLADQVRLAAQLTVPVLLLGEPGTGKQTLARTIHYLSPAREHSFAALDCTRLPPDVLAHFLFNGGTVSAVGPVTTVYLKEPARLPRDLQQRLCVLLRGEGPVPRIMAGSSPDPLADVRSGRLLEDLYHRLAMLVLTIPPLRERQADLAELVERMLARIGTPTKPPDADVWEVLRAYSWPGNLRELYEVLVGALGRGDGDRITAADLPSPLRLSVRLGQTPAPPPKRPLPLDQVLEQVERRLLQLALKRFEGNRTKAAEFLGLWRPRLLRRLAALGLDAGDESDSPEAPAPS